MAYPDRGDGYAWRLSHARTHDSNPMNGKDKHEC